MSGSQGSGGHRDSYRGSDGGRGGGHRRDGGGYDAGGYGAGGYGAGGYGAGGHGAGGYSSGGHETSVDETLDYKVSRYRTSGYGVGWQRDEGYDPGGYDPGGYGTGGLGSGPYQRETGPYRTGTDSGDYGRDGGGYGTGGDEYRTDSGGYRTRAGRRSRSSTGSHRVVRERRGRRLGVIVGGAAAAIGVCVVAAFVILSGVGGGEEEQDGGRPVGSGVGQSSSTTDGERSVVPDSCTIVGQDVVDRLAPGSERTEADNYESSDRQNQCVWGAYTGDRKRQLTVELRAIAAANGRSATETAATTFTNERAADESGKSLLAGQKLKEKVRLDDVGDDGYVVYSVDDRQGSGEAIGNIRLGNVLITIHYSGSNDGDPLSASAAKDGAVEVARAVIQGLGDS